MCADQGVQVAAVCLLLMVQGDVLNVTATHFLTAAQTGTAAIALPLGVTFTRYARVLLTSRWMWSLFLGFSGFVADAFIHRWPDPGAYTEAALTGLGTMVLSAAISYTPVGKRIERLGEAFLHSDVRSAADRPETTSAAV
jgi:hypothetical protein